MFSEKNWISIYFTVNVARKIIQGRVIIKNFIENCIIAIIKSEKLHKFSKKENNKKIIKEKIIIIKISTKSER